MSSAACPILAGSVYARVGLGVLFPLWFPLVADCLFPLTPIIPALTVHSPVSPITPALTRPQGRSPNPSPTPK
jgi:hypothetical protein